MKIKNCPFCKKQHTGQGKTCNSAECRELQKRATTLAKYGSATYNGRDKCKATLQEKYGVDNISQLQYVKDKKSQHLTYFQTREGRDRTIEFNKSRKIPDFTKICTECGSEFLCKGHRPQQKYCTHECSRVAKQALTNTLPERIFRNILDELNIPYKEQFRLNGKLYDFKVGDNILVEVDGVYWHSKDVLVEHMTKRQLKVYNNDRLKDQIAEQHGFIIKRIWEGEITKHSVKQLLGVL